MSNVIEKVNEIKWSNDVPRITAATMILTEDCNLNCSYCFANERNRTHKNVMTKETSEYAVEYLLKGAKTNGRDAIHITYFGGEPMMNLEVMEHSFDYAVKRAKEENIGFDCMLITNATILTPEHIRFVKKWYNTLGKVNIQLSIDGIPSVQDKNRFKVDGTGSSSLVSAFVAKLMALEEEFHLFEIGGIHVHSVISKDSLPHIFESYQYFVDLGFKSIWFMPVHEIDWTDEDVEMYRAETQKIADFVYDKCVSENDDRWFYQYSSLSRCTTEHPGKPCSAGVTLATIATDGEVHPCHHIYFNDKTLKSGSVFDGSDDVVKRQFFLDYTSENLFGDKPCAECDNHACYRCIASNYANNGNFQIGFEQYCKMSRAEDEIRKDLVKRLSDKGLIKNLYAIPNQKFDFDGNNSGNSQTIESMRYIIESIEDSFHGLAKDSYTNAKNIEDLQNKLDSLIEINTGYVKLLSMMAAKVFGEDE